MTKTAAVPIFAWDVSPAVRRDVVATYADRPVWFVDGPTVTGDGFHVVAGALVGGRHPRARPALTPNAVGV